jgi:hypothetical protein
MTPRAWKLIVAGGLGLLTSSCVGPSSTVSSPPSHPESFIRLTSAAVNANNEGTIGYLYQPSFDADQPPQGPAVPYHPQPGDIFLSTDRLWIARMGHKLAGARSPHHSGLIILRPDGTPATLEAGPHDTLFVRILSLQENLGSYEQEGESIWIRRRKTPPTPEQAQRITEFATTQNGKLFAWGRIIGQLTPFRSRGPWTEWVGGPHGNRNSWFCSELACETLVAAGLLDPTRTRPAATYPCDLFSGTSSNTFINEHLDINASWEPPARWSLSPSKGSAAVVSQR